MRTMVPPLMLERRHSYKPSKSCRTWAHIIVGWFLSFMVTEVCWRMEEFCRFKKASEGATNAGGGPGGREEGRECAWHG